MTFQRRKDHRARARQSRLGLRRLTLDGNAHWKRVESDGEPRGEPPRNYGRWTARERPTVAPSGFSRACDFPLWRLGLLPPLLQSCSLFGSVRCNRAASVRRGTCPYFEVVILICFPGRGWRPFESRHRWILKGARVASRSMRGTSEIFGWRGIRGSDSGRGLRWG